ncbi:uncharacterized protein K452DRAFT_277012 [Aplosporella prunicola CBS 121167]|uniref:DUF1168-domain-containing protein n=1 Tax=Aplosporella prunicola CBS 121167 TaxID=1176127 RepID=A0A6A6B5I1_9PEZI|nr:uncharacterized protein K452DRAFT_277012 [Aplosporella prunicola CBS 121167]KAF2138535.1 hypothetical protein K452DRAFT_277012 [Aplosporella prunicola CBS 121167]
MSEPIPESVPTSADPRSQRPTKKRALTPASAQANQVDALFANPDREIQLPSGPKAKSLAPPPEIVANVQGSSAGAGSGEFHVYKASRRREYERLRLMDEETKKEEQNKEFQAKREEMRKKDEAKTNKNKARREKAKARKGKKDEKMEGIASTGQDGASQTLKKLGPNKALEQKEDDHQEGRTANGNADANNLEEIGIVIHDED